MHMVMKVFETRRECKTYQEPQKCSFITLTYQIFEPSSYKQL
jgi:hypothetical protein